MSYQIDYLISYLYPKVNPLVKAQLLFYLEVWLHASHHSFIIVNDRDSPTFIKKAPSVSHKMFGIRFVPLHLATNITYFRYHKFDEYDKNTMYMRGPQKLSNFFYYPSLNMEPGPEIIKRISCLTHLSMIFFPAHKYLNAF